MRRLLVSPRLRTLPGREGERHASALELFFDLVFVVAMAALGDVLHDDPSGAGFLRYGALFVPVWWAWVGYAFYADRFETDDLLYRLATITAMLAIAGVALSTPDALSGGSDSVSFAASYVVIRAILILLYVRAYRSEPRARPLCLRYISGFTVGAALWLASTLVPAPARYWLWAAGMLIELATPLLSAATVRAIPFHASHIAERLGLITIIVLGETVVLATYGLGEELPFARVVVAAAGFLVAACLWWSYFTFVDDASLESGSSKWQGYLYGHLPIVAAIPATGVGVLLATEAVTDASLGVGARWALCAGPACMLLATAIIHILDGKGPGEASCVSRLSAALILVALAVLGSGLSPTALTVLVLAILIAHIAAETIGTVEQEVSPRTTEG